MFDGAAINEFIEIVEKEGFEIDSINPLKSKKKIGKNTFQIELYNTDFTYLRLTKNDENVIGRKIETINGARMYLRSVIFPNVN